MKTNNLCKSLCAFLSIAVFACLLGAAAPGVNPEPTAERFFQTLSKSGSEKAFEALFEGSLFAQAKSEELARMKEDFNKHLAGRSIAGFEQVKQKSYGQSVVKLVYILKLESHPLVWEFYFYKARTDWVLARVGFDEDLRKLD